MKIGAHVEVFKDGQLVQTNRPGQVCNRCGTDVAALLVPTNDGPLCVGCLKEA